MAQFLNQVIPHPTSKKGSGDGFDQMGKPIPSYRKEAADVALKDMGVEDAEHRWSCVMTTAQQLQRDNPHGAMEAAMVYVDLTGAYRLMATLLAAPNPDKPNTKKIKQRK